MYFLLNNLDYITAISTFSTALLLFGVFFWGLRQRQFDFLEQSFDLLQRINEKALENDKNAIAAIKSGNPNDNTKAEEARIIYFHYMRINRMFRAYEYRRGWFITTKQRDRIINPHLGTLKPVLEKLPAILDRGYPPDFRDFLIKRVSNASLLKVIND